MLSIGKVATAPFAPEAAAARPLGLGLDRDDMHDAEIALTASEARRPRAALNTRTHQQ
jgi:hypothetical protein